MRAISKEYLAESIVSRLFRTLGFHVKYNGIEVTHPDLLYLTQKNLIDKALIRQNSLQPDFIILKEKDEVHLNGFNRGVEVKYRKSSRIPVTDLSKYPDEVHFILLDKENFWSISRKQLPSNDDGESKTIKFSSLTLLENDDAFRFSDEQKNIINFYKAYVRVIAQIAITPDAQ